MFDLLFNIDISAHLHSCFPLLLGLLLLILVLCFMVMHMLMLMLMLIFMCILLITNLQQFMTALSTAMPTQNRQKQ